MARASNTVIAGDYKGKVITKTPLLKKASLWLSWKEDLDLVPANVTEYEGLDESSQTSATSAVGRAFLGSVLLGPVGLLAGLSAKKKEIHVVAVQFKDGKKSLLELDSETYKAFITGMFES